MVSDQTPDMTISSTGSRSWMNAAGQYHREDGPAIVMWDGAQEWIINGKTHRIDGPAIIWKDGEESWYVNNFEISDSVKEWILEGHVEPDWKKWSDSDKVLFKLRFG